MTLATAPPLSDPAGAEPPLRGLVARFSSFAGAYRGLLQGLPVDGCTQAAAEHFLRLREGEGGQTGEESEAARLAERAWRVRRLRFVPGGRVPAGHTQEAALALALDSRALLLVCLEKLVELGAPWYTPEPDSAALALHVLAPLAERFGMIHLQRELEDLAFKLADRAAYRAVAQRVALRKAERDQFLAWAQQELEGLARREGIAVQVSSRAKHLWSIYRKQQVKGAEVPLHDLLGLRLVAPDVASCYVMLSALHAAFSPVPGRLKDYIAQPKANGYQSLHSTVEMGSDTFVEVQLRTEVMHESAERGAVAHWIYKHPQPPPLAAGRWVYALTPGHEVIRLPRGATLLDFAYAVHSDLGLHFRGAVVDGHIARSDTALETGQIVRVLSSPRAQATERQLERVRTSRARNRIRHALAGR